ncbi:MAG: glycosyltransferase family 4 protein [Pontiellaceae bacterium]|jgi:glycosyltransferase involved in cell wall biosynthesis|nr:glycosyltransferase family 4 protein [Pontiellaceae bacterium]
MKIAILYDVIYPLSIGGGEKINWEVGRRLAQRGHDVWLVSSKMWEGPARMTQDGMIYAGICRWLKRTNNLGNRSPLQLLLFAVAVFRFLRKERFDAVLCNAFPYLSALTACAAGWFRPVPMSITWYEARGFRVWWKYAGFPGLLAAVLERMTVHTSGHHNTISGFTAERMRLKLGIPPEQISVLPAGVNVDEIRPDGPVIKNKEILYVGRLVKHKRVDRLVEAFAQIAADFPEHTLRIIGPGAERPALEDQVRNAGLAGRVQFEGTIPGDRLHELFRRAQVFVLPSDQEGFGMVLIEAMAAGTPVLAQRAASSAAASIITHGQSGLLFESVSELAAQLRDVLSQPELAASLITGGQAEARRYDWDQVIVPAFEKYLSEIVSDRENNNRRRYATL